MRLNPYRGDCNGNESGHDEGDAIRCAHTQFYDQFLIRPASLDPISACKKCYNFAQTPPGYASLSVHLLEYCGVAFRVKALQNAAYDL